MREAKTRTSWTDQDTAYEDAVAGLARAVLADAGLRRLRSPASSPASSPTRGSTRSAPSSSSSPCPGVPDLYQGCELGSFSLVDPDNRRPVDFARRRGHAGRAGRRGLGRRGRCGRLGRGRAGRRHKLLVTSRALRLRRDHPDWFAGTYEPLAASGPAAGHALAFARGGAAVTVATRLPAGLRDRGGWADAPYCPCPRSRRAQPGGGTR